MDEKQQKCHVEIEMIHCEEQILAMENLSVSVEGCAHRDNLVGLTTKKKKSKQAGDREKFSQSIDQ